MVTNIVWVLAPTTRVNQNLTASITQPVYGQYRNSFIPLACAEWDDSLPFSRTSSIPFCYIIFPATFLHQLFFHPLSPHLTIYFLVYLSILLFQNSCIIPFGEFYFLLFSVHAQTNVVYLTLILLTSKIWWAPNNASKWQMGFNSAFKGLTLLSLL